MKIIWATVPDQSYYKNIDYKVWEKRYYEEFLPNRGSDLIVYDIKTGKIDSYHTDVELYGLSWSKNGQRLLAIGIDRKADRIHMGSQDIYAIDITKKTVKPEFVYQSPVAYDRVSFINSQNNDYFALFRAKSFSIIGGKPKVEQINLVNYWEIHKIEQEASKIRTKLVTTFKTNDTTTQLYPHCVSPDEEFVACRYNSSDLENNTEYLLSTYSTKDSKLTVHYLQRNVTPLQWINDTLYSLYSDDPEEQNHKFLVKIDCNKMNN